ncbi:MAG: hypothetical protein QXJ93_02930 [Candidatus Rehaiarchaeum fermentans]|nr:hypothetical protein [Candidatus Rehaiarchaeum fermentans]
MEPDFTDGMVINNLIITESSIKVKELKKQNSSTSQIKHAENKKYIAIYNKEIKDLALNNINKK